MSYHIDWVHLNRHVDTIVGKYLISEKCRSVDIRIMQFAKKKLALEACGIVSISIFKAMSLHINGRCVFLHSLYNYLD